MELLVVVGIIGVLLGILLPVVHRARRQAVIVRCAANLHQVAIAFNNYLIDSHNIVFWRGADVSIDGMDWYVWGGRETGNFDTDQQNLFNRIVPRPLNIYVGGNLALFQCPADNASTSYWTFGSAHWEWVGNSYNFNATGSPDTATPATSDGLAGVQFSTVPDPATMILFLDAGLVYPGDWHGNLNGNILLCDGHVAFGKIPTAGMRSDFRW